MSECTCRMDGSYILNCPQHGTRNTLIHRAEAKVREMTDKELREFVSEDRGWRTGRVNPQ
jgi:hypothetical protein